MESEHQEMIASRDHVRVEPKKSRPWTFIIAVLLFLVGIICLIVGVVIMNTKQKSCESEDKSNTVGYSREHLLKEKCAWSAEAKRIKLPQFMKKIQDAYYANNPDNIPWQPGIGDIERAQNLKNKFYPYNPDPVALKKKTDHALALFREINNTKVDQSKLTPRESKTLAQVKHFLESNFGVPYDDNYYIGDWMMGPNLFCWQPMCNIMYSINAYLFHMKPATEDDLKAVLKTIVNHKTIIHRYRDNIKLGVKVGMVRSVEDCQAGADAFRDKILKLVVADNATAILDEWFTAQALSADFLKNLSDEIKRNWEKTNEKSVNDSIKIALIEGLGQPLLDLYKYLRDEHKMHCVPNEVSSGLSGLPLDFVYYDGKPQYNNKTTKQLPTGEVLDGKESYRRILPYFTTTYISPEEIYKEGEKQLDILYGELKEVVKNYTGIENESAAINEFKKILNNRSQWHNKEPFPNIESNRTAHERCISPESAQKYCPKRWAAIQKWAKYCQQVMAMIDPKTTNVFHFTGAKVTTPNCPIEMLPHYNPSKGSQFYKQSNKKCTSPSYFGLPFFLKDMGPIFQEWSVTAHEGRPGHHTQVQGYLEHFSDPCGGIPSWLDKQTYYTVFTEGWGLYSENPIMSSDTDIYKNNLLQKYGMLKWQVWRAVRLIVDTGLHYRNMSRATALKMFEDFAWDTSDFAVKEVTRYQSDPGQATAYMLGRLELIKMRTKAEKELGKSFNLKDFHLQVLSQGTSPIAFLTNHIDNWIRCVQTQGKGNPMCEYILRPLVTQLPPEESSKLSEPPRPEHLHYI